jgi:hypothetical protein
MSPLCYPALSWRICSRNRRLQGRAGVRQPLMNVNPTRAIFFNAGAPYEVEQGFVIY